ncbi:C-5 sterol desaturase [Thecamonas trahens ATCC 50062]|uniref:C-5 sterol desaturase n=1 Tax=Thecamonas trahens ATCC 50062 TaxID=461836 RepID=A0A0L0DNQ8_THETB|nr:C-5 sterol desaturase [Thecamonas trahens ATCC 50062]KNC53944.1 C-5 sterol desaturase [Thecamonas trahens ATCC 50062]|eukprot:XP_013754147.1 C-5 sterol desaturase [Thecamonas trahens ATCC 50062]
MDLLLELADEFVLDSQYAAVANATSASYPWLGEHLVRHALLRQSLSLYFITAIGGLITYLAVASFSYHFIFDKSLMKHPKFKKDQIKLEMQLAIPSIFWMSLITLPFFIIDVRGYAKFYRNVDDYGWGYLVLSIFLFIAFTDCFVYWIHRGLHTPFLYKHVHKPHHRWIVSSPFASHAFHPLDGVAQSLPYHFFPLIFPMHAVLWIVAFTCVNIWTICIHEGLPMPKWWFLNSTAHHTFHHSKFLVNHGQYTTFWDRIGGTYMNPHADDDKPAKAE